MSGDRLAFQEDIIGYRIATQRIALTGICEKGYFFSSILVVAAVGNLIYRAS